MYRLFLFLFFVTHFAWAQSIDFVSGPVMNVDRVMHSSVELANHNILVVGGNNGQFSSLTYLNSCLFYNPSNNTFQAAPSMKTARDNFSAIVLNNGNVLVIGGNNSLSNGILECETFDVTANQWGKADSLLVSHPNGMAIKLSDGRVLVAGGLNTNKCELYDPSSNKWSFAGDMLSIHGEGMSLTLLNDGNILAVGGNQAGKNVELFSPITNNWTALKTKTSYVRMFHNAIQLKNGQVLFVGSTYPETDHQLFTELYNPIDSTVKITGKLLAPSNGDASILLDNGNVLTYGIGDLTNLQDTKCFQEYNPNTGLWTAGKYAFIGAHDYTLNKLSNGKIILIGGYNAIGSGVSKSTLLLNQTSFSNCITPNFGTAISGTVLEDCLGKSQKINIQSTSSNTVYSLFLGEYKIASLVGNGSSQNVEIPYNKLSLGKNLVTLKILKPGCPEVTGDYTVALNVVQKNQISTSISLTSGSNFLCYEQYGATYKINSSSNGQYIWYNGSLGSELKVSKSALVFVQHVDQNGCLGPKSNIELVKQVTSEDVKVGTQISACENVDIQLSGLPIGGTWSGDGVNSDGLYKPVYNNSNITNLNYKFCDVYAFKKVMVQSTNKIDYQSSFIKWGTPNDTICGERLLDVNLSHLNNLYPKQYKAEFYINDKIQDTSEYSKDYFLVEYKPDSATLSAKLSFKITNWFQSSACPADSLVFSKTIHVISNPDINTKVIFPLDTVCTLSFAPIKIVKPQRNVNYYTTFAASSEITSPKVASNVVLDTLLIQSEILGDLPRTIYVYATPKYGCNNFVPIELASKIIKPIIVENILQLGDTYYTNEPVTGSITSNADYFEWTIDGKKYGQKEMPSFTYKTNGTHTYQVVVRSKYGCVDTLRQTVSIVTRINPPSKNACLFDTSEIAGNYDYEVMASQTDSEGNVVYIGSYQMNIFPRIPGVFIYKYSKNGKLIWKIDLDDTLFLSSSSSFDYMVATSVTFDENNDLYVTGSFFGANLAFMGIPITYDSYSSHPYVAKIIKAGKLEWFISSDVYEGNTDRHFGLGGSDIKFKNGKLYLAGRFGNGAVWKNHLGTKILTQSPEKISEYAVLEIKTDGTQVKALVGMGLKQNFYYDYTGVTGLESIHYSFNHSGINLRWAATLSPKLQILNDSKIAVFGRLNQAIYFDTTLVLPNLSIKKFYTNKREFTGIIDVNKSIWESVQLESQKLTNSASNTIENTIPLSFYTSLRDKISVINAASSDSILINSQKLISEIGQDVVLVKKIDVNGNLLWHRLLTGGQGYQLLPNADTSIVVLIGKSSYGLRLEGGNEQIGLHTGSSSDLFIIGFDNTNGNVVWFERIGSENIEDDYKAASINNCNELNIMGYRYNTSSIDVIKYSESTFQYNSNASYVIRIPLNGSCPTGKCSLVSSVYKSEKEQKIELSIFPNPTKDEFTIVFPQSGTYEISLANIQGESIKTWNEIVGQETTLSVEGVELGMYLYTAQGRSGQKYMGKLVVGR